MSTEADLRTLLIEMARVTDATLGKAPLRAAAVVDREVELARERSPPSDSDGAPRERAAWNYPGRISSKFRHERRGASHV